MGPAFCTSPRYSPPCTAWKECWQPHKSQASPADGRTWSLASYLTFHSLSKWRRTVQAMDHRSAALPCPPSRWRTPVHHQSSPKAHSVKLWHNSSCKPQWIIKVYLNLLNFKKKMRRWFQGCSWKLCSLLCPDSRWSPIFHKHKPTGFV